MKKLFFILLVLGSSYFPLQAQWCFYPCIERYYTISESSSDSRFYGYFDINDYPYALPVNYCFNPRPCGWSCCRYEDRAYFRWCVENQQRQVCPHCNGYHD